MVWMVDRAGRRGVLLVVLGAVLAGLSGCGERTSTTSVLEHTAAPSARSTVTPAELFDVPPGWPGYQWSLDGRPVGWQIISTAGGPAHCGWEATAMLNLGWPPGTFSSTAEHSRQYIRTAPDSLRWPYLVSSLDLHAQLPTGARATGLQYQGVEIYTSQGDIDRAVYVVGGGVTERWPRSDPMTLCG